VAFVSRSMTRSDATGSAASSTPIRVTADAIVACSAALSSDPTLPCSESPDGPYHPIDRKVG
jgi:hypothetical protein